MAKDLKFIDRGSFLNILTSASFYAVRKRKLEVVSGGNDFMKDFVNEKNPTERDGSSFSVRTLFFLAIIPGTLIVEKSIPTTGLFPRDSGEEIIAHSLRISQAVKSSNNVTLLTMSTGG